MMMMVSESESERRRATGHWQPRESGGAESLRTLALECWLANHGV